MNAVNRWSIAGVICLLCSAEAYAWSFFGPKTYEDCILQGMKGVTSDVAAGAVQRACLTKFPNSATAASGLVRDCAVTYSGGKFVSGKPLVESNYGAITFPNSTSRVFLPVSMFSDLSGEKAALQLMIDNAASIRKICPDIKISQD